MKRLLSIVLVCTVAISSIGCSTFVKKNDVEQKNKTNKETSSTKLDVDEEKQQKEAKGNGQDVQSPKVLINPNGTTLATRIEAPDGYTRIEASAGGLAEFVRNYEMKPDKSNVLLYNGSPKGNQDAHVAVFKLPIENYDLQQCADSIMRMYAEYYWHNKQYDKIAFHFVSGFNATYGKWIQGYNISVGSGVSWTRDSRCDASYESFVKYMRMVFNYASTLSMDKESTSIDIKEIQVGDIFIKGGSPGHVVMVVDVATNVNGKKAFLLAQGYMPAQEFHVLKNPASDTDMWYYEEGFEYPLNTPEYMFNLGTLKRPQY